MDGSQYQLLPFFPKEKRKGEEQAMSMKYTGLLGWHGPCCSLSHELSTWEDRIGRQQGVK